MGWLASSGVLTLTNERVLYHELSNHLPRITPKLAAEISLRTIRRVAISGWLSTLLQAGPIGHRRLIIITYDVTYRFKVRHAPAWMHQIDAARARS